MGKPKGSPVRSFVDPEHELNWLCKLCSLDTALLLLRRIESVSM